MRNWFISSEKKRLCGDIETTPKVWTYSSDLVIKIAQETDDGYKVKTSCGKILLLQWSNLDGFFEKKKKEMDEFLSSFQTI